jgi:predicted nucleic acid-binding protein
MLFIYVLEANPECGIRVRDILGSIAERQDTLVTSIFTLGEVLAGGHKKGSPELVSKARELLQPPTVELLPISVETIERYAQIRGRHGVKPPDALHLACASLAGVNLFLTDDRALTKLVIPGIDFIAGLDVNLL